MHGPLQIVHIVLVIPLGKSIKIEKTFSFRRDDSQLANHKSLQDAPVAQPGVGRQHENDVRSLKASSQPAIIHALITHASCCVIATSRASRSISDARTP